MHAPTIHISYILSCQHTPKLLLFISFGCMPISTSYFFSRQLVHLYLVTLPITPTKSTAIIFFLYIKLSSYKYIIQNLNCFFFHMHSSQKVICQHAQKYKHFSTYKHTLKVDFKSRLPYEKYKNVYDAQHKYFISMFTLRSFFIFSCVVACKLFTLKVY